MTLIDYFIAQDAESTEGHSAGEIYNRLKAEIDLISAAATELKDQILEDYKKDPELLIGVSVSTVKGKTKIKWDEITEEMNIPEAVIAAHTSIGKPSYRVNIVKPEKAPQKYI